MKTEDKHIDQLVSQHNIKQSELLELGQTIRDSARPVVIGFIDLANSTDLKQESSPEEWLVSIYQFIRRSDQLISDHGGTVIKRIGDELMFTFKDQTSSEAFLDAVAEDSLPGNFSFKIALDYGEAYYFRFLEQLEDDPYGLVVDRCARIAKYAVAGVAVCTGEYLHRVNNQDRFLSMGSFLLKGFSAPQQIFSYAFAPKISAEYTEPLVAVVNESAKQLDGYRSVGRRIDSSYLRNMFRGQARPFIARELINVPRLAFTHEQLAVKLRNKEVEKTSVIGLYVEFESPFLELKRDKEDLILTFGTDDIRYYSKVEALMPIHLLELARGFKPGQMFLIRGIITRVFVSIDLNYVDLLLKD